MHVNKNKLHRISYCGEDKAIGDKVFAYIVKGKGSEIFHCFCFETHSPVSGRMVSIIMYVSLYMHTKLMYICLLKAAWDKHNRNAG